MIHGALRKKQIRLILAMCGVTWAMVACEHGAEIRIEAILPRDDPDILHDVVQYDVEAVPIGHDAQSVTRTILRGEPLIFDRLSTGDWRIAVHGFDAQGQDVVAGQTQPFRVVRGVGGVVPLVLGRTGAFNLFEPVNLDGESPLAGLVDHTATAYTDTAGQTRILVAGGRISYGGPSIASAMILDLGSLSARRLETGLFCPRAGHFAIAAQGRDGVTRIALAGGEGRCGRILDIFDTRSQQFQSVELSCGAGATVGLFAELAQEAGGSLSPTGRVVVASEKSCVIDLEAPERAEPWMSALPDIRNAVDSAVSSTGRVAAMGPDGVFESGCARQPAAAQAPHAVTQVLGLSNSSAASLLPLDGDHFLIHGYERSDLPGQRWAVVRVTDESASQILEGHLPLYRSLSGFSAFVPQQGGGETANSESVQMLLTGGRDRNSFEPTAAVAMAVIDLKNNIATWFDKSGTPMALRRPRAGHVAVPVPSGAVWLIGGDEAGSVEMFLPRIQPTVPFRQRLTERKPNITSIVVLDSKPENQAFSSAFTARYIKHLSQMFNDSKQARSIVNAIASADRGVGDETLAKKLKDPESEGSEYWQGCATTAVSASSPVEGVLAYGEVDESLKQKMVGSSDPEKKWQDVDNESEAQTVGSQILGSIYSAQTVRVGTSGSGEQPAAPAPRQGGCPWQQFLRVGFDNLPGPDFVSAFGGVNVLTFVVSNDDCSQGFYSSGSQALSEDEAAQLSQTILSERTCASSQLDDYLGFSSDLASDEDFQRELTMRVNDKRDLIVAFVNVQHSPKTNEPPRRLEETKKAISALGFFAKWLVFDISAASTPDELEAQLDGAGGFSSIAQAIASRNRLQVCLPEGLSADVDQSLPEASPAAPGQLLSPLEGAALAEEVIAKRCHVAAMVNSSVGGGASATAVAEVFDLPQRYWHLGTDTDRLAGCDPGWTLAIDADTVLPGSTAELADPVLTALRDAYDDHRLEMWLICDPSVR